MRLLHTSDWHLGRGLHGVSLIDDQRYLLDQFIELARQWRPHVVVIAGDVYDRAVPPTEAVCLLDEVLNRLVAQLGLPVVLIAGNHDSGERLNFGADLLRNHGLHVAGQPSTGRPPVVLCDEHGPVHVHAVPYAEPAVVRHQLDRPELQGHAEALGCLLDAIRERRVAGTRSVLVGHCFVGGGQVSESERPLSVGGAGMVDAAVFTGFDYVALGHLHRPQTCGDGRVQYSGSLLPYSFGEAGQAKAVLQVEMDADGRCQVERIALTPRRQVRCLSGTLADLLASAPSSSSAEDYLMVTLQDDGPVFDAMGRLREVYPNVLHLERAALTAAAGSDLVPPDHRQTGDAQLFAAFYAHVTGEDLGPARQEVFARIADEARRQEGGDAR